MEIERTYKELEMYLAHCNGTSYLRPVKGFSYLITEGVEMILNIPNCGWIVQGLLIQLETKKFEHDGFSSLFVKEEDSGKTSYVITDGDEKILHHALIPERVGLEGPIRIWIEGNTIFLPQER